MYPVPFHSSLSLSLSLSSSFSLHISLYCFLSLSLSTSLWSTSLWMILTLHTTLSLSSAAPFNVSLSYKNNVSAKSMTLSCSYGGSPQPQLRWLRNNAPLVQRENTSVTVHTSKSSFDSLLTVPLAPGKVQYTFSCLVMNQFGNSSKSIVISVEGMYDCLCCVRAHNIPILCQFSHTVRA